MEFLLPVVLFAISSSVTPGPNNIMVMTSALNFGVRKTLPLLTGICIGFTLMLLMVGLGFSQLFVLFPQLSLIIKIIGVGYLLYLAWLIAMAKSVGVNDQQAKPFGFMKGALFQWVNAKAWVVAIGAISAFTTAGDDFLAQNLLLAMTFFIASIPCVGVWLLCGSILRKFMNNPVYLRGFNITMAVLLAGSIMPVVLDIWAQL